MPVTCRFEEEDRLFVEEWTGTVTPEEEIAAIEAVLDDPRYRAGMIGIVDLRQAVVPFGQEGLEKIFRFRRENGEKHVGWKWAILARTPQQQMVATLYTVLTENVPTEIAVFDDEKKARHWLGLPPAPA